MRVHLFTTYSAYSYIKYISFENRIADPCSHLNLLMFRFILPIPNDDHRKNFIDQIKKKKLSNKKRIFFGSFAFVTKNVLFFLLFSR